MPDITVHFDITGSIEDCASFLALVGFRHSDANAQALVDSLNVRAKASDDALKVAVVEDGKTP